MKTVLRQEREKRNWTQEYVAMQIDTTKQAVQQFESNQCKPSYEVLVKLLDLFGYKDPRELFGEASEPPNSKDRIAQSRSKFKGLQK